MVLACYAKSSLVTSPESNQRIRRSMEATTKQNGFDGRLSERSPTLTGLMHHATGRFVRAAKVMEPSRSVSSRAFGPAEFTAARTLDASTPSFLNPGKE